MIFKRKPAFRRRHIGRYVPVHIDTHRGLFDCTVCRVKGMTLIELMFVLILGIATSYAAFIAYKPAQQWHRVELTLAQNADIIMAAQAYHSLNGHWPNEFSNNGSERVASDRVEEGCTNAWAALSGQTTGVPLTGGLGMNGFGARYGFSCESGEILAPLMMTQSVPFKYLDYFRRYFYRVELPSVLPTDENALVNIKTRIPPTNVSRNVYFAQAELGSGYGYRKDNNTQQRVVIQGLENHQGFIPMPDVCQGLELINIDVFATGMCSPLDFQTTPAVREFSSSFDVIVSGLHQEPDLFHGRVVIRRVISLSSIRHSTEPCVIQASSELNCNTIHASRSDGWRVESSVDLKVTYSADYYVTPSDAMSYLPANTLVMSVDVPNNLEQSRTQFEHYIFNRLALEQNYRNVIVDLMNGASHSASGLNTFGSGSASAHINSVRIHNTPHLAPDILLEPDVLEGIGDCHGYFSATLDQDISQDIDHVPPQMFTPKIAAVLHCAG